jgi:hypothetical protein
MSENDGKNERQLTDWAGLAQYLEITTLARMRAPPMWYTDIMSDSLMSWLLWMTISRRSKPSATPRTARSLLPNTSDANSTMQSSFNQLIVQVMHPFIVTGYRVSSWHRYDFQLINSRPLQLMPRIPTLICRCVKARPWSHLIVLVRHLRELRLYITPTNSSLLRHSSRLLLHS